VRRILLLITDLEIGGTPTVVRELAIRLRGAETHVEVASLKDLGPVGAQLAAADVVVKALNASNALSLPLVVRRLRRLIHERSIDTVVSFLVHANVVAALAVPRGVRLIQSIQTTQVRPRWHWVAQRWAARAADRIVVPSESVAQMGRERSAVPREKIVVIANAVDPGAFPHSPIPADSPQRDYPIGFIGRLDPVKRLGDLIWAVAPLENVTLHIFGSGPERENLRWVVEGTGNVVFHGTIKRPQEALAKIGLLVLPSEAEGFGLVLIEAMAASVPVVASSAPGIRDVVQHEENGLLVPVGDVDELRRAIERVVGDADLRARLIKNGLRTVRERYTWEVVLPRYRELLSL
jgi:glycosyltransferase involved in cell wall biosynthesis